MPGPPPSSSTARLSARRPQDRGVDAARHHVLFAVFVGGSVGTALRAGVGVLVPHHAGQWPWSTLLVNAAGALLIGWWSVRLPRSTDIDPRFHPLLSTGICGGLTTFSAMGLDTLRFSAWETAAYLACSVAVGLAGVAAGRRTAHVAHRRGLS